MMISGFRPRTITITEEMLETHPWWQGDYDRQQAERESEFWQAHYAATADAE